MNGAVPKSGALSRVVHLMEGFLSGEAIGVSHARELESAILELADADAGLEALADELAEYSPSGGDLLFGYQYMKPRVARQLEALRRRQAKDDGVNP